MKLLTIFTSTYNRKHTICRTFQSLLRQTCKDFNWLIIDDGSSDGTKEWVESLGLGAWVNSPVYDWMGRKTSDYSNNVHFVVDIPTDDGHSLHIDYIRKPNGGLYTGYNVAYDFIQTELCVCIDSDDFAPDDAVEKISKLWKEKGSDKYCGIIGLDFYLDNSPIGGYFPKGMTECYRSDLFTKNIHHGDCKEIMRTTLMRKVAPQIGFEGEKNFNPAYMLYQVWDKYPLLTINENLCFVDYQLGLDSMSQAIFKQYVDSPRSFAKLRILHFNLQRYPYLFKFKEAAHYISSCIFSKDKNWLRKSPMKLTTIIAIPLGLLFYTIIKFKNR